MDKKTIIEEISKGAETVVQLMQLGKHEIKIIAQRAGYTPPCEGDYVKVKISLHLPMGSPDVNLHPDLQYGMRKNLMSEWMYQDWGMAKEGMRVLSDTYRADTWREAVTMGLNELEKDLTGLLEVMAEREAALKRAEG